MPIMDRRQQRQDDEQQGKKMWNNVEQRLPAKHKPKTLPRTATNNLPDAI